MDHRRFIALGLSLVGVATGILTVGATQLRSITTLSSAPITPQPTPDRLAIPTPPENPTQAEMGNIVYYYHCMPCHGDVGQGLTDEWREVWVEDHRNCWARGCHGGRIEDEGFPLPRYIPGVQDLSFFSTPEDLHDYLALTHPPQRPGALTEEEYWAVTAHLLVLTGQLPAEGHVGPGGGSTPPAEPASLLGLAGAGIALAALLCTALLLKAQVRLATHKTSYEPRS